MPPIKMETFRIKREYDYIYNHRDSSEEKITVDTLQYLWIDDNAPHTGIWKDVPIVETHDDFC